MILNEVCLFYWSDELFYQHNIHIYKFCCYSFNTDRGRSRIGGFDCIILVCYMYWIQYGINTRIYKIIIVIDSIILIEYHIDFICNLTHSISIVSSILLLFYFQIIHEINLFKRIIVTLFKLLFSQQNILLVSNSLHSAPSLQSSLFASFVFRSYTCFCHCYFAHSHYSAFKFAVLS